tara:strand:+ start:2427 stop:2795 length:369 start_codon:yes stop_codon:yes gene_type:complete
MSNGYTKGISKMNIEFCKIDTCLKEENGNMTIIRKLFLDLKKASNQRFVNEQLLLFREHIASKIDEALGPIKEETICEVGVTRPEKVYGDSKKDRVSLIFEANVFKVKRKEEYGKKQLTFDC